MVFYISFFTKIIFVFLLLKCIHMSFYPASLKCAHFVFIPLLGNNSLLRSKQFPCQCWNLPICVCFLGLECFQPLWSHVLPSLITLVQYWFPLEIKCWFLCSYFYYLFILRIQPSVDFHQGFYLSNFLCHIASNWINYSSCWKYPKVISKLSFCDNTPENIHSSLWHLNESLDKSQ